MPVSLPQLGLRATRVFTRTLEDCSQLTLRLLALGSDIQEPGGRHRQRAGGRVLTAPTAAPGAAELEGYAREVAAGK